MANLLFCLCSWLNASVVRVANGTTRRYAHFCPRKHLRCSLRLLPASEDPLGGTCGPIGRFVHWLLSGTHPLCLWPRGFRSSRPRELNQRLRGSNRYPSARATGARRLQHCTEVLRTGALLSHGAASKTMSLAHRQRMAPFTSWTSGRSKCRLSRIQATCPCGAGSPPN